MRFEILTLTILLSSSSSSVCAFSSSSHRASIFPSAGAQQFHKNIESSWQRKTSTTQHQQRITISSLGASSSSSDGDVEESITTTKKTSDPKEDFDSITCNEDECGDMPHAISDFSNTKPPMTSRERFLRALPKLNKKMRGDTLDRSILETSIPSMINLAVVPIVNSVDTFWVGRMGDALALAGQAAANQAFFTLFFLISFLPNITAPLVAKAVGSGDQEAARDRVCESLFLCNVLGGLGMLLLVAFPKVGLSMVLPPGAPAMEYAAPYLRLRALSMIPALMSATGFAAYRGMLNTVTPLKVSLATNAMNLVLDPLTMFGSRSIGFVGAALATALSETAGGLIYLKLLLRRKLAKLSLLVKPPSWSSLLPLIQGGLAMLFRQAALNAGFVTATRRAQAMDPTGVSAAAYGIVMQIYVVGIVVHVAMQGTAAALVPAALAKSGKDEARFVADRTFIWASIVGILLSLTQLFATPFLVPVFSTLPEVQEAVKAPAHIAALLHVLNGPIFAGEGIMLGLARYKALATITSMGVGIMVACLGSPLGKRLDGILLSLAAFSAFQAVAVVYEYLRIGPLSRRIKGKLIETGYEKTS